MDLKFILENKFTFHGSFSLISSTKGKRGAMAIGYTITSTLKVSTQVMRSLPHTTISDCSEAVTMAYGDTVTEMHLSDQSAIILITAGVLCTIEGLAQF